MDRETRFRRHRALLEGGQRGQPRRAPDRDRRQLNRTRIKICCIASSAEAHAAITAGADAVGLVSAMPSGPGPIDDALIAQIAADIPPPVTAVLLTAESRGRVIAEQAEAAGVSTVQIVREISPREHQILARERPGLRRLQVLHVDDATVLERARHYHDCSHGLLLDSGRPNAANPELGGTGRTSRRTLLTSPFRS